MVHIIKADMLYVSKEGLSPAARNRLLRLAAFGNPEFYRAQAMHQSVFGKPRIICLAEERGGYIALPRGAEKKLVELLKESGVPYRVSDERFVGPGIRVSFNGELRDGQSEAVERLLGFENGILSAPTGFGKTVIGAAVIAQLKTPTLVIGAEERPSCPNGRRGSASSLTSMRSCRRCSLRPVARAVGSDRPLGRSVEGKTNEAGSSISLPSNLWLKRMRRVTRERKTSLRVWARHRRRVPPRCRAAA